MTQRHVYESGAWKDYTLTYDAENRLTNVTGAATAQFTYNGDGQRVKSVENGTTKVYIGNYFEWNASTSTMKRYYYAGATRVAMREGNDEPLLLLGDHLGSTNKVANYNGTWHGTQNYKAWGETRFVSGDIPTDFHFTGQREDSYIGLYDYGARWYDPSPGRFTQADIIIPEASQGVQAWDRYAYVNNSPVQHIDPSGHSQVLGELDLKGEPRHYHMSIWDELAILYGITFAGKGKWTEKAKEAVILAAYYIGHALVLLDVLETVLPNEAFVEVFGKTTVFLSKNDGNGCKGGNGTITCGGATDFTAQLIAHELGHVFSHKFGNKPYEKLHNAEILDERGNLVAGVNSKGEFIRTLRGYKSSGPPDMYHGPIGWKRDWNVGETAWKEDWADMFMNWAFNNFNYQRNAFGAGTARYEWMTTNIAEFIQ